MERVTPRSHLKFTVVAQCLQVWGCRGRSYSWITSGSHTRMCGHSGIWRRWACCSKRSNVGICRNSASPNAYMSHPVSGSSDEYFCDEEKVECLSLSAIQPFECRGCRCGLAMTSLSWKKFISRHTPIQIYLFGVQERRFLSLGRQSRSDFNLTLFFNSFGGKCCCSCAFMHDQQQYLLGDPLWSSPSYSNILRTWKRILALLKSRSTGDDICCHVLAKVPVPVRLSQKLGQVSISITTSAGVRYWEILYSISFGSRHKQGP